MQSIDQRLATFGEKTVLCVGDLMLDHFVYGEVSRVSPEAPSLVIAVGREEQLLGGAGNVARGVAALGARCIFIGDGAADLAVAVQYGMPFVFLAAHSCWQGAEAAIARARDDGQHVARVEGWAELLRFVAPA